MLDILPESSKRANLNEILIISSLAESVLRDGWDLTSQAFFPCPQIRAPGASSLPGCPFLSSGRLSVSSHLEMALTTLRENCLQLWPRGNA